LLFPALGAAYAIAAAFTVFLPAYSAERPLALDLTAHYDMDAHKAALVTTTPRGALPKPIRDQLDQPPVAAIPGTSAKLPNMPMLFEERPYASAVVTREPAAAGTPAGMVVLAIQLEAPGAQQVRLSIPEEARPASLQYAAVPNAVPLKAAANGFYVFSCVGRSCDGGVVRVTVPAASLDAPDEKLHAPWLVQGNWTGLPSAAQSVAALRTDAALPVHGGDSTLTTKRLAP
jgi:hypothetical protein